MSEEFTIIERKPIGLFGYPESSAENPESYAFRWEFRIMSPEGVADFGIAFIHKDLNFKPFSMLLEKAIHGGACDIPVIHCFGIEGPQGPQEFAEFFIGQMNPELEE
jgi:hypothetical protein